MNLRLFATIFGTIFIAEIADKTQLATLLLAADARNPKLTVFAGAALALVAASAAAVLAGSILSRHLNPRLLSTIAGAAFIVIGIWTMARPS